MATVFIPPMMQRLTGGIERVEVDGKTLRQIVAALEERFPGTKRWLCEGDNLRPGVAAAIDGEVATMGLIQPVPSNAEVHFIPALSGG
jgi:molybdopterin converting factor small subunit